MKKQFEILESTNLMSEFKKRIWNKTQKTNGTISSDDLNSIVDKEREMKSELVKRKIKQKYSLRMKHNWTEIWEGWQQN